MLWIYLLVIGILCRSISMIVQKSMLRGVDRDHIAYAVVSQLITGAIITAFLVFTGFHPQHFARVIPNLIITTVLAGIGTVCMFASLKHIDSSEFTILYSSRVMWTIIGTILALGAPFAFHQVLGTLFIVGSIILISWKVKRLQLGKGEILALFAALAFGIANANDAVAVKQFDVILYSIISYILPALLTWVVFPKSTKHIIKLFSEKAVLWLVFFCFLLAIAAVCLYESYRFGNPPQVSAFYQTSTILAVVLAIILLKETTYLKRKIAAVILTFIGVLLVR